MGGPFQEFGPLYYDKIEIREWIVFFTLFRNHLKVAFFSKSLEISHSGREDSGGGRVLVLGVWGLSEVKL